jgi:hypothetical protein
MKIQLESNSQTLAEFRAELEAFLGSTAAAPAVATAAATDHPAIVEPVIDMAPAGTRKPKRSSTESPAEIRSARSAADIALGLDLEGDAVTAVDESASPDTEASPQADIEDLLADKAQLNFDFDRVLALQGRAAALGIVRGVLPAGTKAKLKDLEALPIALIPAAIAALQAAQEA